MSELPTISYYCKTGGNTSYTYDDPLFSSLGITKGGTSLNALLPQLTGAYWAHSGSAGLGETVDTKKEEKVVARLIRYTVVDADVVLADKAPEHSILMSGTVMLNGSDDKAFLMELSPAISEKLIGHNIQRAKTEYEDKEGKTRTLKPIKIGSVDVVIEVLREYK